MTINLTLPKKDLELKPRIVVFGVGGAGGNAVNNMIRSDLQGVDFVVGNTDAQSLALSQAERKIQLGVTITEGLGAGARPDIGRAAAEEGLDEILDALDGSHMAFITAGMGGGTGTGSAPVIARAARERGILTVGVVTKPFHFEGQHRMRVAEEGIEELQQFVDTLIIIPNQNLFRVANEKTTFADAFKMADDVLYSGVRGVTDLMVMPGLINLDFADIRTVMSEMGKAMMGTGEAEGEGRAVQAAEAAISNPLLDEISMKGARGVLINITGGLDLTLFEVDEAANRIRDEVDPAANIIFGSTFDESMEGTMRVSVVATGIDANAAQRPRTTTISLVASNPERRTVAEPPRRPAASLRPMRRPDAPQVTATALAAEPEEYESHGHDAFDIPVEETAAPEPELLLDPDAEEAPEIAAQIAAETAAEGEAEEATAAEDRYEAPAARRPVFVAPPPVEPDPEPEPAPARPDPFVEADYSNAARTAPAAEAEPAPAAEAEPAPAPARKSEGGRAASLFRRMTRAAREIAEAVEEPKPARAERAERTEPAFSSRAAAPAPAPAPASAESRPATRDTGARPIQPRLGGLDPKDSGRAMKTDEDLLEIPAFLRRQAN